MYPNDWPRVKVKDVCDLIVDCVNRTAPVVDYPTPYKMIRTTNVRHGKIDLSSCRYVDEETFNNWTRRAKVFDGDVILTREAPIGEVGYINGHGNVFLGQRLMQYRSNSELVNSRYLFYAFRSKELQDQFRAHDGSGSVVSHIRVADCHEFLIPVPPLSEQKAIVEAIGALDDKIELNRQMNETLEAMARAIFKDWFVDFGPTRAKAEGRPPYLAPDLWSLFPDRLDDDGKPEGWRDRALVSFFDIIGGGTPSTSEPDYWNGEIPWFSVVDTPQSAYVLNTQKTITQKGLDNSSTRLIFKGVTIISARGTIGNLAIAGRDMAFNQSCYALKGINGAGEVFVFLLAQHLVNTLQSMSHGSVFSTITRQTFEATAFTDAGERVLNAFEALTEPLFAKIKSNTESSDSLGQTRDLILPKLMSGDIRIKDAEKIVRDAL